MTKNQLEELAHNTKISLDHIDSQELLASIEDTLQFVKEIEKLNIDGVKPFEHPLKESVDLRQDTIQESLPVEDVLANAPSKDGNFIKVPKVV